MNCKQEGADYAHHITTCPPPLFLDLPTALMWKTRSNLSVPPNSQHSKVQTKRLKDLLSEQTNSFMAEDRIG